MTNQAVIVFQFPEPEDSITLGMIIANAKKQFEDMQDIKVHMAINDTAKTIISALGPDMTIKSNLVEHALKELARIESDPWMIKGMVKIIQSFADMGHSGGSASWAIPVINELLQFKNLTPLTDDPSEWNEVAGGSWQSCRNSEAFSYDGGKTYYLLSENEDFAHPEIIYDSEKHNG